MPDIPLSFQPAQDPKPLRLAYMTSISEISGPNGGEFVGQRVTCPDSGMELGRRMGHLEALARGIMKNRNGIEDLIEIGLVIYHDTDEAMEKLGFDGVRQTGQISWPWPTYLPGADGQTLGDMTHQVVMYTPEWKAAMSSYRRTGNVDFFDQAREIRRNREEDLVALLHRNNIDVLLTDSATYIFQGDMAVLQSKRGKVVNIHPAVLGPIHPDYKQPEDQGLHADVALPGLIPTQNALYRYNRGIILGEKMSAEEAGKRGLEIEAGRVIQHVPHLRDYAGHGATLHQTVAQIDAGPIIHAVENPKIIQPGMTKQQLRHAIFELSTEVLLDGLVKFARIHRARAESVLARSAMVV